MGGIKSKCMAKTPQLASYLDFILYLHGQVENFEQYLSNPAIQMFRRDMVKMMSKYGKVSFKYENLYLVGQQQHIAPLSTIILMQLQNKGACVPFTCDYRGIIISRTFPTVQERQAKKYNYLVACNRMVWNEIDTCKNADGLVINYNNINVGQPYEGKAPPIQNMEDQLEIAMALSLSEQEAKNKKSMKPPPPPEGLPPYILNKSEAPPNKYQPVELASVSLAYQHLPVPSIEGDGDRQPIAKD